VAKRSDIFLITLLSMRPTVKQEYWVCVIL